MVLIHSGLQNPKSGEPEHPGPIPTSILTAPESAWTPIVHPKALIGLEGPVSSLNLEAREHKDGGREDTLTLGRFGDAGYTRIAFMRRIDHSPDRSLFIDIVHRAASAGLSILRYAPAHMVVSKFGALESISLALAPPAASSGEALEQACQAFRFADDSLDFAFQGWSCGAGSSPVSDTDLACLIDRLALQSQEDLSLMALFAQAEARRAKTCPQPVQDLAGQGLTGQGLGRAGSKVSFRP